MRWTEICETQTVNEADAEAQLKADYADLYVSCGYIGDITMGPVRDFRSFRVFTQLSTKPHSPNSNISIEVFDVPRDHQGVWREKVAFDTPEIRAKLDKLRERLAKGEIYFVSGFGPEAEAAKSNPKPRGYDPEARNPGGFS